MRPEYKFIPRLTFFLLWPFGALTSAIRNCHQSWAKNIVWFFVVFFGFTMVKTEGGDANRYIEWFREMVRYDWSLNDFISLLYRQDTRYVDVVQPLLSFALSRFTDDSRVLFAVFGLVFGYFYSRNIWYLVEQAKPRIRPLGLIFIIIFALVVGFWQINGFRFWTATQVFMFGLLPYLYENRKNLLWVSGLSIFFHFSFFLPLAILLVYFILGNRLHLLFALYFISFVITEINLDFLRNAMNILPDLFQDRTSGYLDADNILASKETLETLSWHAKYYQAALKYAVFIYATVLYANHRSSRIIEQRLMTPFCFTLFCYGTFNIMTTVVSAGRFIYLGNMLFMAMLFLFYQKDEYLAFKKKMLLITSPALLLYCIVSIRSGLEYMGPYTFLGNPLTALWGPGEVSIISFIKN